MERCSVTEMRKNLECVEQFKRLGVDFVPIPVFNKEDKDAKLDQLEKALEKLATIAEGNLD